MSGLKDTGRFPICQVPALFVESMGPHPVTSFLASVRLFGNCFSLA